MTSGKSASTGKDRSEISEGFLGVDTVFHLAFFEGKLQIHSRPDFQIRTLTSAMHRVNAAEL